MPLPLNTDSQGVPYLAYDSTYDRVYSEGGVDAVATASIGFATINGGAIVIAQRNTASYRRRTLWYNSTINATVTISLSVINPQGVSMAVLVFTIPTGTQNGWVNSSGGFAVTGSAPTKTSGDYSALDMVGHSTIGLTASQSGAASGACDFGLVQLT